MPRIVRDWEIDERGEYFSYFDPYHAQREAEGELTAAQANVVMFTPYLRNLKRRWRINFRWLKNCYRPRRVRKVCFAELCGRW